MNFSNKSMINRVVREVYGRKYDLVADRRLPVDQHYAMASSLPDMLLRWKPQFSRRQKIAISVGLVSLLLAMKMIMAVYYYNLLIDTQQNMLAAHADIDALVQRRNDIAKNLSKAVLDYSQYEQQVFTSIVSLRTMLRPQEASIGKNTTELPKAAVKGDRQAAALAVLGGGGTVAASQSSLLNSLSKLMAVAEQYPDLKLSVNFGSLMAALVEVERDLAAKRIIFNEQTNIYTTNVAKFPCNIFAWLFGFKQFGYFKANDEAKDFKVIEY
ncbi:MAG: LemA family protein [Desulfobulbaceae bacterium]|nr:LemA family protein [Desulfobulbaceae bacterium]HIJ79403.1 hypothetical protein [Deltaproteobacteria bacterium]